MTVTKAVVQVQMKRIDSKQSNATLSKKIKYMINHSQNIRHSNALEPDKVARELQSVVHDNHDIHTDSALEAGYTSMATQFDVA